MNRRHFLQGFLLAAGGLAGRADAAQPRRYPLGIQFFTFNQLASQGWEQFSQAMELAKRIGYDGLQFAGLMGHAPERVRKRAEELGLSLRSIHMGNDQVRAFRAPEGAFGDAQDAVYTPVGIVQVARVNLPIARDLGCEWGVIAASGNLNMASPDKVRAMADALNKANDVAQRMGLKLSYHNHAPDFAPVEGQIPFDILVANTDPSIRFELDVCWVQAGGGDPVAVINRYPDRIVSFHLKDMDANRRPATPGDGIVDFAGIHAAAGQLREPLFYVERDGGPGVDLDREARRALAYLRTLGWGSA